MSGIEVAGLVLGAFPLALSALGKYRETAETLAIFWKIRREYKAWTQNLNICKLVFEQNIEEFLLPLIVDDEELDELIKQPGGEKWRDPELEGRLRQRLPKSYDLYLEIIDRIHDVMKDITRELGIERPDFQSKITEGEESLAMKASSATLEGVFSKANAEFQTRRLKMTLNQAKRDKLFKELTDCNENLRMLLDTSDRIASLRQTRHSAKKSAETKGLWQFWRHADRLYDLLAQSWRCQCKKLHMANLLLQHRIAAKTDFRIMFLFAPQQLSSLRCSWVCQEADIRMLEAKPPLTPQVSAVSFAEAAPETIMTSTTTPSRSPSPSSTSSKPFAKLAAKKSALKSAFSWKKRDKAQLCQLSADPPAAPRIPTLPPSPQILITDSAGTAKDGEGPPVAKGDPEDIVNLCDTLAALSGKGSQRAGCLTDQDSCFALDLLDSRDTSSHAPHDTITMEQLLLRTGDSARSSTLTRRQRYGIALTLASSYLQLHSSSWISRQWSKRDIHFVRDAAVPGRAQVEQPYISCDFHKAHGGERDPGDRSLAGLGIMLLELLYGAALEDHETRRKYPFDAAASNHFLDMAAALEWCAGAEAEGGPEFADAILWCLRNMPGSGGADGNPERWREELYQKVVEPLKYCHDQFVAVGR